MVRLKLVLLALFMTLAFASPSLASVVTLTPSEDTYARQDMPDCAMGGNASCSDPLNLHSDLQALSTTSPASQERTYLKFANVPANQTDARLRMYVSGDSDLSPYAWVGPCSWSETTLTWNNRPSMAGTQVNGLDPLRPQNSYLEWNLSSIVPSAGGTVCIALFPRSTDGAIFDSKENTHPPQLVVTSPGGTDVTSTLTPSDDSYARQDIPDCAEGSTAACADSLNLQSDLQELSTSTPASQERTYVKFGGVPANASSVKLRMYVSGSSNLGPYAWIADNAWAESTLTWNNRPAASGVQINGSDPLPQGGYQEWNVSTITPSAGGTVSYALFPRSTDGAIFDSKENTHPPQLVVTAPSGTSDTQAPTAPGNVTKTGSSQVSIDVSWTAATDNVGVTSYERYQDGVLKGDTNTLTHSFTGLTCGTSYSLVIKAKDAAGNTTAASPLVASTDACSTQPTLAATPASLSYAANVGGPNPSAQNVSVSNTGTGTMPWTVATDQTWLSATPASGTDAGTVVVSATTGALAAGTYNGNVTITATGAVGSPKVIPVTFVVSSTSSNILFEDDFNGAAGTAVDSTKWTDFGPGCGAFASFGSIQCGTDTVDGSGHLQLTGTPSAGRALQTKGKFDFQYGTVSAWIKMPSQAGYWPGWWTLNGSQTGSEAITGESDITEVYTQFAGSNSQVHVWNGGAEAWKSPGILCCQSTNLSAAYHKYSAKYESTGITYYMDDVQVGQVLKANSPSPWGFQPDTARNNYLLLDLAVGGGGQAAATANGTMLVDRVEVTSNATPPPPTTQAKNIFVMMMENTDWSAIKGNASAPYINNTLLPNYSHAENMKVGMHNSLPNYLTLESGDPQGQIGLSPKPTDVHFTADHLAAMMRRAGVSDRQYHENLPSDIFSDPGAPYSADHNAPVYFKDVQDDTTWAHQLIRPYSELTTDLANNTQARYNFLVPNDFHQGEKDPGGAPNLIQNADNWLKVEIPKIQASAAYHDGGVIYVLWDEGAACCNNPSGLIVVSDLAKHGYQNSIAYNLSSVLRTNQRILGLSPFLGAAASATDLSDLFTAGSLP